MKKIYICLFTILSLVSATSSAQTTAMDFQRRDCNGTMHHLYDDLDSGNIVVLEFFMDSCTFCVDAAHALEVMQHTLKVTYNVNVVYYAIGYNNLYPKPQIINWVGVNHLRAIPMDSGKTMVNYYGGFGMPTVVILGGTSHSVISSVLSFLPRDTSTASAQIVSFVNGTTGIAPVTLTLSSISIYPNPISEKATITMDIPAQTSLQITLTDLSGQALMTTAEQPTAAGPYMTTLDVSTLPRGIYLVTITTDGRAVSREISILR